MTSSGRGVVDSGIRLKCQLLSVCESNETAYKWHDMGQEAKVPVVSEMSFQGGV